MGFLRVVEERELNIPRLLQVWQDAVTGDGATALRPRPGRLREGEKVIVAPGQMAVLINNGKPEDIIDAAGGYLYYSHLKVNGRVREYAETLDGLIQAGARMGGSEVLLYLNAEDLLRLTAQVKQPQQPSQSPKSSQPQQPPKPSQSSQQPQKMLNICPKCGYDLWAARRRYQSVKFCPGCGTALS